MSLGYRSCKVLMVIAAQPGASNREVADAAEVSDQGQISKLLARLENLRADPQPGRVAPRKGPCVAAHGAGQTGRVGERRAGSAPPGLKAVAGGVISAHSAELHSRLTALIRSSTVLMRALRAARTVNPPDWLIGGGVIRDRAWDHLHGYAKPACTKDVDLAFCAPRGAIQPGRSPALALGRRGPCAARFRPSSLSAMNSGLASMQRCLDDRV